MSMVWRNRRNVIELTQTHGEGPEVPWRYGGNIKGAIHREKDRARGWNQKVLDFAHSRLMVSEHHELMEE